uniref:Uncharacterized protein n=1 Tax=Bubo bubo TaxID=30461 RepID=A0A8C0FI47_BUBBB
MLTVQLIWVAVAFFSSVKQKILRYLVLFVVMYIIGSCGLLQSVADCLKLSIKDIHSFIKDHGANTNVAPLLLFHLFLSSFPLMFIF